MGARYWREFVLGSSAPQQLDRDLLLSSGFAIVIYDLRGTGASFGAWEGMCSPTEIGDMSNMISWVTAQPWSNGLVISRGQSYAANVAELSTASKAPGHIAAVARFPDLDLFGDLFWPGGIPSRWFPGQWDVLTRRLDGRPPQQGETGEVVGMDLSPLDAGPKPVDDDNPGRILLGLAVKGHSSNFDLSACLSGVEFRDDPGAKRAGLTRDDNGPSTPSSRFSAEASLFVAAGWWDAATARAALRRYLCRSNAVEVSIGPWAHGGRAPGDPFAGDDDLVTPSYASQLGEAIDFMQRRRDEKSQTSKLRYFCFGANEWRESSHWPPQSTRTVRLSLDEDRQLTPSEICSAASGVDTFAVDFSSTSGMDSRWHTQINGGRVTYRQVERVDGREIQYTTGPLACDVEITGTPVAGLWAYSNRQDFALFAYLELVKPSGATHMITEGCLRASRRKVSPDPDHLTEFGPYQSLLREDCLPVIAGEAVLFHFGLQPVSLFARENDRVRIRITGHDDDNFERFSTDKSVKISLVRGGSRTSWLDLPLQLIGKQRIIPFRKGQQ
jgi:hypothetical protein